MSRRLSVAMTVLAQVALACSTPETAIVVRIDSDLRRGSELTTVHLTATPAGAALAVDAVYDLTSTDLPLPGTVVLHAASGNDDRALAVAVVGSTVEGGTIERDYSVHFEPGHVLVLDVYLARRCAQPGGFACDPASSTTCGPCDCDPVDPGALPDYARGSSTTPPCFADGNPPPVAEDAAVDDTGEGDASFPCVPQQEVCNGRDDDCNGLIDDGLGYQSCGDGACRRSVQSCVDGSMSACTPAAPQTERCNGIDDDCDGAVDDGNTCGPNRLCGQSETLSNHPWMCCRLIAPGACPPGCAVCETVNGDPTQFACCNLPTR